MNSYKRNYSSLGFVAGDVEVDWGDLNLAKVEISPAKLLFFVDY